MKYLNTLQDKSGANVWTSGNDGAGSGLDADLLDGKHESSFYQDGSVIMNTNPFGGKKLYINSFNNALFSADKRWTVTATIYNSDDSVYSIVSSAGLFDGNYEGGLAIPMGKYLKVSIDFNGWFPNYPYGNLYISHYYTGYSQSAKLRVYCNYAPHTIGWHEFDFSDFLRSGTSNLTYKAYQSKYAISLMEIIIYAKPDLDASITDIEFQLDRPSSNEMPFIDKYKINKMYYNFDMNNKQIINLPTPVLTGDAANKAYVDSIVTNIPTKLSQLTNDLSMGLIQTVSSTAPTSPKAGQVWMQTY